MTRTLDGDILTEIPKGQIQVALLAAMDFSSGYVRVWSGIGNLTFGGQVYSGVGYLGEIAPIQESGNAIRANAITLQLSGIPSALLDVALLANYQGRTVQVWLGFFDTAWALIDCALLFAGRMDTMAIDEGPETSIITLSAESHLADLKRPRVRRFTHADQQELFAGDKGFEYVEALQNAEIAWGPGAGGGSFSQSPPVISSGTGGGGIPPGGWSGDGGSGGPGDQGAPDNSNNGPGASGMGSDANV